MCADTTRAYSTVNIASGDILLSATEPFLEKHTVTANRQFVRFSPDGTGDCRAFRDQ